MKQQMISLWPRVRGHLSNLTAFTVIQAASYLIPIITIPYLARALTVAGLGQLAVAGAFGLIAGVAMDYAVQLSGTRFAASNGNIPAAINTYLNTSTALKLLIFAPIALCLCLAPFVIDQVRDHFWVFFWSLISAGLMCLFPQWLFQGMRIMPQAARILVICRIAAAAAAILLVQKPGDAFIVPMAQAIAGSVGFCAAIWSLRKQFAIRLGKARASDVRALLKGNWPLFSATAWGAAYSHGAVLIMGAMLTATNVGYYSIAQKISQACVSMFNVAAQTGFPTFVRSHDKEPGPFRRNIIIYLGAVGALSAGALILMYLMRATIYAFFAGHSSDLGVTVFTIWLVASFFTVISVSLNPVMIALRLDQQMARVYRFTGLTFLVFAPIACLNYGVVGMAAATLFTEMFMALFCTFSVKARLDKSMAVLPA
jgi:polysaccharide transporter, PST family